MSKYLIIFDDGLKELFIYNVFSKDEQPFRNNYNKAYVNDFRISSESFENYIDALDYATSYAKSHNWLYNPTRNSMLKKR